MRNICKKFESIDYKIYKKIGSRVWNIEELSHSQNCEDIILDRLVSRVSPNKDKGYYIDIGAHHPNRFSNTFRFYQRGWSGINIDPLPHVMDIFARYRSRDINLNVGCGEEKGKLEYYSFVEPAYNTLNKEVAKQLISNAISPFKEKIEVDVLPLKDILDKYLTESEIDFMDLDVESYEIQVLKGNDWNRYRPKIIVMESWMDALADISELYEDKAIKYIKEQGYRVVSRAFNAVFLVDNSLL